MQQEFRLRFAHSRSGYVRWGGVCVGGMGGEFQLCPQGVPPGAGSVSQNFPKTLAGSISAMRYVIAFKFSQNVEHTKDYLYAKCPISWELWQFKLFSLI